MFPFIAKGNERLNLREIGNQSGPMPVDQAKESDETVNLQNRSSIQGPGTHHVHYTTA